MKIPAIVGDETHFSLEHRMLNALLFTGVILPVLCNVINYLAGLGTAVILANILGGFVWAALYYLSIARKQYIISLYATATFFLFIFTPIMWINNGGMFGSFPYFIVLFCPMIAAAAPGYTPRILAFLTLATVGILIVMERKYPHLIRGYANRTDRFIDISFSILITIAVNSLFSIILISNYDREREKAMGSAEQLRLEIARRQAAQEALKQSEALYRDLVETSPDAIVLIDLDGRIVMANQRAEELTGFGSREEYVGKNVFDFIAPEHRKTAIDHQRLLWRTRKVRSTRLNLLRKDGSSFPAEYSASLIVSGGKPSAIVVVWRDITDRKQMEERLEYLATHDPLTGAANRYLLEQSIDRAVSLGREGSTSILLLIDLDNFKSINDTCGHAAGDKVLQTLAALLQANLRRQDMLTRLGGDEFAILLNDANVDDARAVAEKLRRAAHGMRSAFFNLTISIGMIAIDGSMDSRRLLSLADKALYAAKGKGGDNVVCV